MREVVELEALNSFVITVVEESSFLFYFPFRWVRNKSVLVSLVVCNLVGVTVLFCLSDGTLRPGAGGQVVSSLMWGVLTEKVLADGAELLRCASLKEEDCVVFWDAQKLFKVCLGSLCDFTEEFTAMRHLHD